MFTRKEVEVNFFFSCSRYFNSYAILAKKQFSLKSAYDGIQNIIFAICNEVRQ